MLSRVRWIRFVYTFFVESPQYIRFYPLKMVSRFIWFLRKNRSYKRCQSNPQFTVYEWYPCLNDNTTHTPIEPVYFYQDSWAARKLFELTPSHHYDIGSSAKTIGILSQFVPITMVDIRSVDVNLPNLYFKEGSILELPFDANSIESLSSLCVIEHIGLGRYGDPIDPYGSEKAAAELTRVMSTGGVLLISVPVDTQNTIYFNAHRAFTRVYLLSLFDNFEVLEERYLYGTQLQEQYDPSKGFGTGLFMLKKKDIYVC